MRRGPDIIVQAPLGADGWFGYADVLRRIEVPSELGPWSYEVQDTKLARETRGGTILQLCAYTEMLGTIQGHQPESFHVVTPTRVESYRFNEFAAYYRLVVSRVREFIANEMALTAEAAAAMYPEPCDHCELCRWSMRCEQRRRADDHLSFVAGLARIQQVEFEGRGIQTLAAVGALATPIDFVPARGSVATYERLRHQAALQVRQRETRTPTFDLLPLEAGAGLLHLPEPSAGDLFLDLEGDPFAREGGREYLFGLLRLTPPTEPRLTTRAALRTPTPESDAGSAGQGRLPFGPPRVPASPDYTAWWALDDAGERAAFEQVVDRIMATLADHPGMHVYHYAAYEPTAFKRLAARHATREAEVDVLLRGGRFVDLYAVVRRALRAGVESYSIKKLEPFYGFGRGVDLSRAGDQRRIVEIALETAKLDDITGDVRAAVEGYNDDDCRSTLALRDWLEELRRGLGAAGVDLARPEVKSGEGTEKVKERDRRAVELRAALLDRIAPSTRVEQGPLTRSGQAPSTPPFSDPVHDALYLLAHLVDWHRREERVAYGEYHRLRVKPEDELRDEPRALVDLEFTERVVTPGGKARAATDRYRYPVQENDVRPGDDAKLTSDVSLGKVEAVDKQAGTIDIKKRVDQNDVHPTTIIAVDIFNAQKQEDALCRIAGRVLAHGLDQETVVRDLLLCRPAPALASFAARPIHESAADFAVRIAPELAGTQLAIQGPPGSGKTHTGARMIAALLAQGRKVGVVATSHKVIRKLLVDAARAAGRAGTLAVFAHKRGDDDLLSPDDVRIEALDENPEALAFLQQAGGRVLGGTAWLWAREEFQRSVHVLFVDEAGQMSLANALAVSEAAQSVVLLGDPQQLDQPQKASHPAGADRSALEHLLGGHQTIPEGQGLFLPTTHRLAPAICAFTSEAFYEGRLQPLDGLERQRILAPGALGGAGLRLVEVAHHHCRNASDDEAAVVARLIERLLQPDVQCVEFDLRAKVPHPPRRLAPSDILVVAPYNAHVAKLRERLDPVGVAVGTVDKFQGQEAPVVIYSMATSRPEEAPRGMEFLYSLNRLNVATSRARCLCIMVASPRLFEPDCRTPQQMKLASALCRFREVAIPIPLDPG